MDEITENLKGCVGIADDLVIIGATEEEHDENLIALLNKARIEVLVFSSSKYVIKTNSINFFGTMYTSQGIKPGPEKVGNLKSMIREENQLLYYDPSIPTILKSMPP